jgi:type II secretion system protein H
MNGTSQTESPACVPGRTGRNQGFTLIEIMLVVVIILIAIGVAVPAFRGTLQSTQMKDAVRSTIRMSRFARNMAILKQTDCTLEFTDSRIELRYASTNEPSSTRRFPEDIQIELFENLSIETDEPMEAQTAGFYSNGTVDGFKLTLQDSKNRTQTIICKPITGKVVIEE